MFMLKLRDVRWASLIPRDRGSSPRWTSLLLGRPWCRSEPPSPRAGVHEVYYRERAHRYEPPPLESECTSPLLCTESAVHRPSYSYSRLPSTATLRSLVGSILPGPSGVTKRLALPSDASPEHFRHRFGNPLRDPKQISDIVPTHLYFISHDKNLQPVWCRVDAETMIPASEF